MKIIAVTKEGPIGSELLLDAMFQLRARVFEGRLGWDVATSNGRERDQFDDLGPSYILAIAESGGVVGCARLLPASGPTMLASVFPHLVSDRKFSAHDMMVESSRFCVDTSVTGKGNGALNRTTRMMFAGILEWCLATERTAVVTVTDIAVERILARAGWPLRRLGPPQMIGETAALAGVLSVDPEIFRVVKPTGYQSDFHAALQALGKVAP